MHGKKQNAVVTYEGKPACCQPYTILWTIVSLASGSRCIRTIKTVTRQVYKSCCRIMRTNAQIDKNILQWNPWFFLEKPCFKYLSSVEVGKMYFFWHATKRISRHKILWYYSPDPTVKMEERDDLWISNHHARNYTERRQHTQWKLDWHLPWSCCKTIYRSTSFSKTHEGEGRPW